MNLTRREAIARLGLLLGGTVVGGEAFLRGEPLRGKAPAAPFTDADRALLDEIGETIIPATDTPGAKATGIGAFIITMVNDCYGDADHAAFQVGLGDLEKRCRRKHGASFLAISPPERTAFLNELEAEGVPYFRRMKELTILGYFTSEIGCTQALRYIETPGDYRCDPYRPGDRAWFDPPRNPRV